MLISKSLLKRIEQLKKEYERHSLGKEGLLKLVDEAELPESVYNSNAIENSTLTLRETEKILLEMEVSRNVSLREVFEAKNLARVMELVRKKVGHEKLTIDMVLELHQLLLGGIEDNIAGRFRTAGEYVRVGTHIAPPPEVVEKRMAEILQEYSHNTTASGLDRVALFHLDFEMLHPFNDGNGRIGRVMMNWQLMELGFPPIIIRNKEKKKYYQAFKEYEESRKKAKTMGKIVSLALLESLHKRLAYLQGADIITLAGFAKQHKKSPPALLNAARRQTIPAFREKGVWKISQ